MEIFVCKPLENDNKNESIAANCCERNYWYHGIMEKEGAKETIRKIVIDFKRLKVNGISVY